jgi:hypothetical protein
MPRQTKINKQTVKAPRKKPAAKGTGRNGLRLPKNLQHSHVYQTSRKLKAYEVPEGTLWAKLNEDSKKEWICVKDKNENLAWRLKTDNLIERLCTKKPEKKSTFQV